MDIKVVNIMRLLEKYRHLANSIFLAIHAAALPMQFISEKVLWSQNNKLSRSLSRAYFTTKVTEIVDVVSYDEIIPSINVSNVGSYTHFDRSNSTNL